LEENDVRRAVLEDAHILASLRKLFWEDQISKGLLDIPPLDAEALLDSSVSLLKRPRTTVYLAFRGAAASGSGYIYGQTRIVPGSQSAMVGSIEELYVDPVHGAPSTALALMRNAIEDLKAFGATRVKARVLNNNTRARKFHELGGFSMNLIVYELDMSVT
jgi:ribosomal protein S18 acetylase RimI-like enzyme